VTSSCVQRLQWPLCSPRVNYPACSFALHRCRPGLHFSGCQAAAVMSSQPCPCSSSSESQSEQSAVHILHLSKCPGLSDPGPTHGFANWPVRYKAFRPLTAIKLSGTVGMPALFSCTNCGTDLLRRLACKLRPSEFVCWCADRTLASMAGDLLKKSKCSEYTATEIIWLLDYQAENSIRSVLFSPLAARTYEFSIE
jgi:hypothetical protein